MADLVSEIDLHAHGVLEAHAGTGKTYTIVGLVVRLLSERKLSVRDILLVTYTQKAAGELLERIRKGIRKAADEAEGAGNPALADHLRRNLANLHEALVGTIHSTCLRLLKAHPFESGIPFSIETGDDPDGVEACLRELLRRDDWKGRFADPSAMRAVLDAKSMDDLLEIAVALGTGLLDPGTRIHPPGLAELDDVTDSAQLAGAFAARWAAEGAKLWKERKSVQGLVSFHDMLELMERALGRPEFLAAMRSQVKVGIVDEFQDTSARQWSIFRGWFLDEGPAAGNLYLVGDPKQSIYSFQGADVRTYQRACETLKAAKGNCRVYKLQENWRSLPNLIQGCNGIFRGGGEDGGWFLDPSIRYEPESQAKAPRRNSKPVRKLSEDLFENPVRIAKLEGTAPKVKDEYARRCAEWILALHGREADLPEGDAWKTRRLDWGDFAVVVSTRTVVPPFRRVFDELGIPWALYKQQGVFASRTALEFRAVLRAVHAPVHDAAARSLALSTRLLQGDEAVLDAMRAAAMERRWARMLRFLSERSGAAARLLGASQGDRHWMDLRQVADYALEYLLAGTGGLAELGEHLSRLQDEREQAADDRNLLASATDRGRVQILTMHVSKGLEFPVVFLAGAAKNNMIAIRSWIDEGEEEPGLRLMPAFLKEEPRKSEWAEVVKKGKELSDLRIEQETRRLNYVAITRPKLLLVVPCHEIRNADGQLSKKMPALARAVHHVLDDPPAGVALLGAPPDPVLDLLGPSGVGSPSVPEFVHTEDDLRSLSLPTRSRLQTSYTQVAKVASGVHVLDGRVRRSEESDSVDSGDLAALPDAWLPRGARTGDALHEILESWMDPLCDNSWLQGEAVPARQTAFAERTLAAHGLDASLAPKVADLLREVLRTPLALPGGATLRLCDLEGSDRRPETEFHWAFGKDGSPASAGEPVAGWMVGYIDLLFRHDRIWYVLDWKTTSLERWTREALEESVREHSYDLQARLYGRTVASALPAGEAFGGGLVVYLRAYADASTREVGVCAVEPVGDDREIDRRVRHWMRERGRDTGAPE